MGGGLTCLVPGILDPRWSSLEQLLIFLSLFHFESQQLASETIARTCNKARVSLTRIIATRLVKSLVSSEGKRAILAPTYRPNLTM